jgi:hypothetical protein
LHALVTAVVPRTLRRAITALAPIMATLLTIVDATTVAATTPRPAPTPTSKGDLIAIASWGNKQEAVAHLCMRAKKPTSGRHAVPRHSSPSAARRAALAVQARADGSIRRRPIVTRPGAADQAPQSLGITSRPSPPGNLADDEIASPGRSIASDR